MALTDILAYLMASETGAPVDAVPTETFERSHDNATSPAVSQKPQQPSTSAVNAGNTQHIAERPSKNMASDDTPLSESSKEEDKRTKDRNSIVLLLESWKQ